jgi:hypothetical protein
MSGAAEDANASIDELDAAVSKLTTADDDEPAPNNQAQEGGDDNVPDDTAAPSGERGGEEDKAAPAAEEAPGEEEAPPEQHEESDEEHSETGMYGETPPTSDDEGSEEEGGDGSEGAGGESDGGGEEGGSARVADDGASSADDTATSSWIEAGAHPVLEQLEAPSKERPGLLDFSPELVAPLKEAANAAQLANSMHMQRLELARAEISDATNTAREDTQACIEETREWVIKLAEQASFIHDTLNRELEAALTVASAVSDSEADALLWDDVRRQAK